MFLIYAKGLAFMASLIVAIGAQNAFVLRQGVRREQAFLVASICLGCDVLMVGIGCLGVGTLIAHTLWLRHLFTWGGALFLLGYAFRAFRSALRPQVLKTDAAPASRGSVIMTALAVSLLNPGAILDTVVLVGGASGKYLGWDRFVYAAGAITASTVWFYGLSYGAQKLAPVLARPKTWRVIDCVVGAMMLAIAATLIRDGVRLAAENGF